MAHEIICGIYKITAPNGKVYVGQSKNVYKRWDDHKRSKQKTKISESINKFGGDSHTFELLEVCDVGKLLTREKHFISLFNSDKVGLNDKIGCPKKYTEEMERVNLKVPKSVKPKVIDFAKKESKKLEIKTSKVKSNRLATYSKEESEQINKLQNTASDNVADQKLK